MSYAFLRSRPVATLLLALLVGHCAWSSVWLIERNEAGVVLRLGRVARVTSAGAVLTLPWPLEELERVETTEVRSLEVGFPAEERAQFWPVVDVDAQWLTGDTNIVELKFLVRYTIEDPVGYLFSVVDPEGDRKDQLLRYLTEGVVTALVAEMPIDDVLASGKAELQRRAKEAIQENVDRLGLGLRLAAVDIAEAAPPAQVISAFNDVTSATNDRERAIDEADGFRRDLLPKERARANRALQQARQARERSIDASKGATQAFLALLGKLDGAPTSARRRIWLEGVMAVLERSRLIVYPSESDARFRLRIID